MDTNQIKVEVEYLNELTNETNNENAAIDNDNQMTFDSEFLSAALSVDAENEDNSFSNLIETCDIRLDPVLDMNLITPAHFAHTNMSSITTPCSLSNSSASTSSSSSSLVAVQLNRSTFRRTCKEFQQKQQNHLVVPGDDDELDVTDQEDEDVFFGTLESSIFLQ